MSSLLDRSDTRIAILGGGPGGYEAATVASQLGAQVTLVEDHGLGGSAVLTDVVPSKSLIAVAEVVAGVANAAELGIRFPGCEDADRTPVTVDLGAVNRRLRALAAAQTDDIRIGLEKSGVRIVDGFGRLLDAGTLEVTHADGAVETLRADSVLVSTGAHPRELPDARPDGERILTWKQLYGLDRLPERLVVIGSGVTGAEFASAYRVLGADVVLVSSRDRVLPGQDADAADVIEDVFRRGGMTVLSRSRALSVARTDQGVLVTLADGRRVEGSHCLVAVGSIPNTGGIGLEGAGVVLDPSGHIRVNRVSRTSVSRVYAAGDCTDSLPLASVAAMQGRTAMFHALGDAVVPVELRNVASTVFTSPEIATVGFTQRQIEDGEISGIVVKMPLSTNPRAKMLGIRDGFVKLFCRRGSGTVIGGVVVAPKASELIFPVALAVQNRLTVDEMSHAFTVYPSLSGSIGEAARRLHQEWS